MGCIFTKPDRNGRNKKIFRVYNVDEHGEELNHGRIEVTDSELILYHKQKEIRWPLRCLRRYGWDEELFSFESGRRCATGPGIFAFKCQRAEVLFNSVQECIRQAGQSELNTGQIGSVPGNNSRRPSMIEIPEFPNRNGHQNSNGNPRNSDTFNYVNQIVERSYENTMPEPDASQDIFDLLHNHPMNYTQLDFPSSDENIANNESAKASVIDNRSPPPDAGSPISEEEVFIEDNTYINVQPDRQPARPPPPVMAEHNNYTNIQEQPTCQPNYILVETPSPGSTPAPAPAPSQDNPPPPMNYVEIDINKMEALQNIQRNRMEETNDGSRPTRHNSTIDF